MIRTFSCTYVVLLYTLYYILREGVRYNFLQQSVASMPRLTMDEVERRVLAVKPWKAGGIDGLPGLEAVPESAAGDFRLIGYPSGCECIERYCRSIATLRRIVWYYLDNIERIILSEWRTVGSSSTMKEERELES